MDRTLQGLVRLVAAPEVETRCAALLVLAELGVDEEAAVDAVRKALQGPNAVVRDFALTHLERTRPKAALGDLLSLLDSDDDGLRRRAVEILATYGAAAVAAARKRLDGAPKRRRHAIVDLCGRARSPAAHELILHIMAAGDPDTNRLAVGTLEAAIRAMAASERAAFYGRVEAFAERAGDERIALVSALDLFGFLGDKRCRKRLFGLLGERRPQAVRAHALAALVQCLRGEKVGAAEVDTLLGLLDEADENAILRPALSLLDEHSFDRKHLGRLQELAESPQGVVKRFAVHKLGSFDSGAVVKKLIGYLDDASYARRSEALATLKKTAAARQALMKELLACDDERRAWTLAEAVLAHDRGWRRDVREQLWSRLTEALDGREDRLYSPFLQVLRELDGAEALERIRAAAEQRRKKKKFSLAARWLALLRDTPAFDDEARFALAVCELKSHKHALLAAIRRHDPAVELLRGLAATAMPLADRLRKERVLEAEDLFYVGFSFAEGSVEERALARDVLAHVAGKYGRTKVGRAAKNKLDLLR